MRGRPACHPRPTGARKNKTAKDALSAAPLATSLMSTSRIMFTRRVLTYISSTSLVNTQSHFCSDMVGCFFPLAAAAGEA